MTTNASTVGVPPATATPMWSPGCARPVPSSLQDEPARVRGRQRQPGLRDDVQPARPSRTSGGSSSGSAALAARASVTTPSAPTPAARSASRPLLRHRRAQADVGSCRSTASSALATCDYVARSRGRSSRRRPSWACSPAERFAPTGRRPRVGVLRRQLEDPDVRPEVRARVEEPIERLAGAGLELVDVDVAELDLADEALGAIILKEAYDVHRDLLAREERLRPGHALAARGRRRWTSHIARAWPTRSESRRASRASSRGRCPGRADGVVPGAAGGPPFGTPEGDIEARFTGPYNLAGVPAVSLPCGIAEDACRRAPAGRGRRRGRPAALGGAAYEELTG